MDIAVRVLTNEEVNELPSTKRVKEREGAENIVWISPGNPLFGDMEDKDKTIPSYDLYELADGIKEYIHEALDYAVGKPLCGSPNNATICIKFTGSDKAIEKQLNAIVSALNSWQLKGDKEELHNGSIVFWIDNTDADLVSLIKNTIPKSISI